MMRRCSSGCHGNMVGTCSCGLFHHHHHSQSGNGSSSSAFSMFFSSAAPSNHRPAVNAYGDYEDAQNMYSFASSSSSVDCTLSLGTPSTRLTTENEKKADHHRSKSSFCWDIFQSNKQPPSSAANHKSGRPAAAPDVARRCANCDTTSTPLWRNGPRGPKSLCNACGIRYKKEERRASAAAATANGGAPGMDSQQMMINNPWVHHHQYSQAPQKVSCYPSVAYGNEFRFIEEDDHRDSDAGAGGISFLSWRLNVADRPSLVHDFTR
ncbi:PREDICTED: GATA transcription factor 19-like [Ipomoea nil]|uniref:GATA transcription factor 19-like n=1 Tax=Ipomoea nil TaxID=35883 RepID=UPI0009017A90|nr:PREDICTED: GATA transcription factor 19-like [Ipomoea nil]